MPVCLEKLAGSQVPYLLLGCYIEVLLKILCHNIVVLIASMYELGIEPIFRAEQAVARQEVA